MDNPGILKRLPSTNQPVKSRPSINLLKAVASSFAAIAILPAWTWFRIESMVVGRTSACLDVSQLAAQWTGLVGVYLRRALLKHLIAKVGRQVSVSVGTVLTKPSIELGDYVYIGRYGTLGDVRIGDYTLIGDHVYLLSGQHGILPNALIKDQPEEFRTVTVGTDCWIGSGSIIMADVGNYCVVGAGSIITQPVPDYLIVAGNPAKPIGDRRRPKVAA